MEEAYLKNIKAKEMTLSLKCKCATCEECNGAHVKGDICSNWKTKPSAQIQDLQPSGKLSAEISSAMSYRKAIQCCSMSKFVSIALLITKTGHIYIL